MDDLIVALQETNTKLGAQNIHDLRWKKRIQQRGD